MSQMRKQTTIARPRSKEPTIIQSRVVLECCEPLGADAWVEVETEAEAEASGRDDEDIWTDDDEEGKDAYASEVDCIGRDNEQVVINSEVDSDEVVTISEIDSDGVVVLKIGIGSRLVEVSLVQYAKFVLVAEKNMVASLCWKQ